MTTKFYAIALQVVANQLSQLDLIFVPSQDSEDMSASDLAFARAKDFVNKRYGYNAFINSFTMAELTPDFIFSAANQITAEQQSSESESSGESKNGARSALELVLESKSAPPLE
jgi:hypothetical protein